VQSKMIHLKLLATAVFWGGTFVAGRLVSAEVPPFTASFIRFVFASAILVPMALKARGSLKLPKPRSVVWAVLLGLTGIVAYNTFFFAGLKTVPAGRAALIIALNPVLIFLFSGLLMGEQMGATRLAGVLLAICGTGVVISKGDPAGLLADGLGAGDLLILGAVASWVLYSVLGKVALKHFSPLDAVAASSLVGCAFLATGALGETGLVDLTYSLTAWAGIAYTAYFGTVLGFKWYYEGIHALGAGRAGVYINFVPVSGVALGCLLLGEQLEPSLLAGAVLVTLGVWLTNNGKLRRRRQVAVAFD
jgi:drug/metabolite transporter (DMT)-like permease